MIYKYYHWVITTRVFKPFKNRIPRAIINYRWNCFRYFIFIFYTIAIRVFPGTRISPLGTGIWLTNII